MRRFPGLLLVAASWASCAQGSETGRDLREGDVQRECTDGRDNDEDGAIDCDDDGCTSSFLCSLSRDADAEASDASDAEGLDADVPLPDASELTELGLDGAAPDSERADGVSDGDVSSDSAPEDLPDDFDTTGDIGPASPLRDCTPTLRVDPPGSPGAVHVAGEWNGWSETSEPLQDADGDGLFERRLAGLEPGEYAYKFLIDGEWESTLPDDVYTVFSGSVENRLLVVADCSRPALEVVDVDVGSERVAAEIRFLAADSSLPIDLSSVRARIGDREITPEWLEEESVLVLRADGLPRGKWSVFVDAADTGGAPVEEPAFVPLWIESEPFTWQDATMYFAFTDRFRDGDVGAPDPIAGPIPGVPDAANYSGGDFLGVIHAIEEGYFDELGVNLLWLSPVYENPDDGYLAADGVHQFSGFHGYWPTSSRAIEFRFGDSSGTSTERLHQLIDAAHARGIRVLFDLVLNHVHEEHEYVGSHPAWFTASPCVCTTEAGACNWDTNPIGCWFRDYLPDLDYRNREIVRQVSDDVEWLVTEFDVDAFRVDAAKHMEHVIMRRIAMRLDERFVRAGGASFYLVGETYTGASGHGLLMEYVRNSELDGQFDFPLLWPIRDVFAGSAGFRSLASAVRNGALAYGGAWDEMSPFIGNHDVSRLATVIGAPGGVDPWASTPDPMAAGGDSVTEWNVINRMSLAFAFLLTQPGVPLIYYGDEIGLWGGGDPDNRRRMSFDPWLSANQEELLGRVRRIGQARRDVAALRRGRYVELWVDDSAYVYARDSGGGEIAVVAMNRGEGRTWGVPIPAELGVPDGGFHDVLGTPRTATLIDGDLLLTLAPWEYMVLVPD